MMFKIFLGTKNAIVFPEKNFEPIWRHFFVTLINHWVSRDPPPFRDEILKNYIKKEKHILFIQEAFHFLTGKFIGNVNIFQKFFLEIYTSFTELKFLFFHFK